MGRLQMSEFSVRLEKTRPVFASDGRTSSPEPEINRVAGPVIFQFFGEIETCHRFALSPAFALNRIRSSIHSAGAGGMDSER